MLCLVPERGQAAPDGAAQADEAAVVVLLANMGLLLAWFLGVTALGVALCALYDWARARL